MSNDIEVQCNIINKLVGTMNQWEQKQKVLCKDVDEGQCWLQQLENGTMAVLLERLEKLETRMAEKDEEIASRTGRSLLHVAFGCLLIVTLDLYLSSAFGRGSGGG